LVLPLIVQVLLLPLLLSIPISGSDFLLDEQEMGWNLPRNRIGNYETRHRMGLKRDKHG
jgi:hypothetical protein